ncbi:hypothetical protein G5I_09798 [Acromyrmex echinatior]|uniref:Uncharacterized protein n=1 Tax=Acromyrmex echinatior TaxID=103372 RepID=F4WVD0_ACREC|nr:hypothetical protein G5I_09798 [Acromyrmex echinatior]
MREKDERREGVREGEYYVKEEYYVRVKRVVEIEERREANPQPSIDDAICEVRRRLPASPTSSSTTPTSTSLRPAFLEVPTRLISNEAAKGRANDIVFASVNFVIRDITAADLVAMDPGMKGEEGGTVGNEGGRIAVAVISRNFEGNEITLTREKVEDCIKMSRCFKGLCNFRLNARILLFIDLFPFAGGDVPDESKVGNRVRGKGLTPGSRECARE